MKHTKMIALMLMISILFAGCGTSKTANDTNEESPVLTMGLLPSIDSIPFILAHEQGFDKKHGVTLDLQMFKSAKDRDAAFQAGTLEAVIGDLVAIAIYNEADFKVKIASATIGEFDLLTGADEVNELKDLKGKSVIFSKNTSTEYAVAMMLKEAGLRNEDITLTEVPQIPTRLELLKNKKADAAILPEPFVTMGKAEGLRVLSSTTAIGINPFIIGIPEKVIEKKAKEIKAMYAAYDEAVAYMKAHDKSEYMDIIIKEVGYPETLKEDIVVADYKPAYQASEQDIESAFAWAREKGLLKKELTPKDVISNVAFE